MTRLGVDSGRRPGAHLEDFQCRAQESGRDRQRFPRALYCGAYRGCRGGVLGALHARPTSSSSPDVGVLNCGLCIMLWIGKPDRFGFYGRHGALFFSVLKC